MNRVILLVEDNPDDVKLTLRAFKEHNLGNSIVVARDGVEALDYMFGTLFPYTTLFRSRKSVV